MTMCRSGGANPSRNGDLKIELVKAVPGPDINESPVHAHVCDYPTIERCNSIGNEWLLLLEHQRRPAYAPPVEVDHHFDAVGDLYQGDAFVHAVILAVEGHSSFNLT